MTARFSSFSLPRSSVSAHGQNGVRADPFAQSRLASHRSKHRWRTCLRSLAAWPRSRRGLRRKGIAATAATLSPSTTRPMLDRASMPDK